MNGRLLTVCLMLAAACDRLPGRPHGENGPLGRSAVMDFTTLYGNNCAGCHGTGERPGAAIALADPVYLAFADDATLRRVTAEGVPGTTMPGFARHAGGLLTDAQIDAIVREMRSRWGRPDALGGVAPPPYVGSAGDPARGGPVYAAHCASCHGPTGAGGPHGGSIIDGAYLGLVSDQGLRTAVVVGRPALGMTDWRGDGARPPVTQQEIADVVAWLIVKRPQFPGQPYPIAEQTGG